MGKDSKKETTPKSEATVRLSELKPEDIFIYEGKRYKRAIGGKKNLRVILLKQAQVLETPDTYKTIEYGVERLELPADTQVLKSES